MQDPKARLLAGQSIPQHSGLVDSSGRALTADRPPERVTAVKFLRNMAEQAGGVRTPQGQAIHRAAGHMVMLYEELKRCGALKEMSGEHSRERLEAAAEGIYVVARQRIIEATGGARVPDAWAFVLRDRPEEAEGYIAMAIAALGGPVFIPPCTEEEAAECSTDQQS